MDLVLFFGPAQIAGVSFGLVINRCLGAWLIMALLLIVLSHSAYMCIKQYKRLAAERKNERQTAAAAAAGACNAAGAQSEASSAAVSYALRGTPETTAAAAAAAASARVCCVQIEESEKGCWTLCPLSKWLILGLLWLVDVGLAVIRGSKYSSFHLVPFCGWEFWLLYAAGAALMLTASAHRGYLLVARDRHWEANGTQKVKGDLVFTHSVAIQFFFQSICAGMIGGIVGIGGSMVMGPLMLARGLLPSVVTAVNTASVLSSSSSAAIKSLINGSVPWDYCLLFCCMCFAAALIGKFLVDRVVSTRDAS
ncbi:sulfite exporter TauE/SafE family protein 5 [Cyclospora cayetanensis]|uniref:Sulfite exporter TauE/SafE family protein 5 n=1 Tax=Cyclospora cayetanensis TaxID=88456 RepID=A0A6P6S1Y2_9EIME|nr:sulfite exporter TauE/SafE family protein 5 [Cyclospora cayetanensis]